MLLVCTSPNPLIGGVVNRLVARVGVLDTDIGLEVVGIHGLGLVGHAVDEVVDGVFAVGDALDADLPAPLEAPATQCLFSRQLGPLCLPPTIVSDDADERGSGERVVTHGFTDAVTEVPGCLVGNSEGAFELLIRTLHIR